MNLRGEISALFVGDPLQEHREGVKLAKEVYATEQVPGLDVVVSNAYLKSSEAFVSLPLAIRSLGLEGGTLVMIINAPEGQIVHYLMRSFGKGYGGQLYADRTLPPQFKVIVLNPLKDLTCVDMFTKPHAVTWARNWGEVLEELRRLHPNGAKVAVYPDATTQYLAG
jgi:nickel-dependent lactate racemase